MYIVKQITPQNKYEKNKFHYKEHKHYHTKKEAPKSLSVFRFHHYFLPYVVAHHHSDINIKLLFLSVTTCLLDAVQYYTEKKTGKAVCSLLLDTTKAFDKVS